MLPKRLKELKITKNKASVEAHQAMEEEVQVCLKCFYDCPPPLGIYGEPRHKLIGADEFGITLEKCNEQGGGR